MKTSKVAAADIVKTGLAILNREMGIANTLRFLGHFTVARGNYTESRDSIIGNPSIDEIVAEIKQRREQASQHTKAPPKVKKKRQRRPA